MLSPSVEEEWKILQPRHQVNTQYLLAESEVCTGDIKLRPCCIDRAISEVIASRTKFDIPIKTERSRLISILLFGIFSNRKLITSHIRSCART